MAVIGTSDSRRQCIKIIVGALFFCGLNFKSWHIALSHSISC